MLGLPVMTTRVVIEEGFGKSIMIVVLSQTTKIKYSTQQWDCAWQVAR